VRRAEKFIAAGHHAVIDVSTGGYVNYFEASGPVSSYHGASFARLRAVRDRYDPTSFSKPPTPSPERAYISQTHPRFSNTLWPIDPGWSDGHLHPVRAQGALMWHR